MCRNKVFELNLFPITLNFSGFVQVIVLGSEENKNTEYSQVNLSYFFDDDKIIDDTLQTGIIVFTKDQEDLINKLKEHLSSRDPEKLEALEKRLKNVEDLAKSIALFPSLLERANTMNSIRTPEALAESIVSYQEEGDRMLHMPSKAILSKGFLVAKIHTFFSMTKLAKNSNMSEDDAKAYNEETVSMMFTLMAEDVYLDLIRDKSVSLDIRRELANLLIILWEHRSDQSITDVAPILQSVWSARRKLAPVFGTMMGTAEIMMLTMEMDEQWTSFIRERLIEPDVAQALDEFMFGISYEQILSLRKILREQKVKSIDRDELSSYLSEHVKIDVNLDYRDFYLLYTVRRDNARVRHRLHLEGPKSTLEDHFIRFVVERNKKLQERDVFEEL